MNLIKITQILPELLFLVGIVISIIFATLVNFNYLKIYQNKINIISYTSIFFLFIITFSIIVSCFNFFFIFNFNINTPNLTFIIFLTECLILFSLELFIIIFIFYYNVYFNSIFIKIEYWVILLGMFLGFILILLPDQVSITYLGLELVALSSYILASGEHKRRSFEAALKYFSISALASSLFLLGLVFLFFESGHLDLLNITYFIIFIDKITISHQLIFLFGIVLVFIGLFFKFSTAPFHTWTVDVYQGISYPVLLIFMVLPKFVVGCVLINFSKLFSLYPLIKFYYIFITNNIYVNLQTIFIICAMLSFIIGTFGALQACTIKKFLAYTTITHVGYIIVGISILFFNANYQIVSYLYLVIYVILVLTFFIMFLFLSDKTGKFPLFLIQDLKGLYYVHPLAAITVATVLFSMAGIPPFMGFGAKYLILSFAYNVNYFFVCFVAVFTSVISCFYYIKLVSLMFFITNVTTSKKKSLGIINEFCFYFAIIFNIINLFGFWFFEHILNHVFYFITN